MIQTKMDSQSYKLELKILNNLQTLLSKHLKKTIAYL